MKSSSFRKRLLHPVYQFQGFIQVQDGQAESSQQAEVGNRRAEGQTGSREQRSEQTDRDLMAVERSGRRRVESRGGSR